MQRKYIVLLLMKDNANISMRKIVYSLLASAVLTSCASQYSIEGQTSSSDLEGKKIILKALSVDGMQPLDSCEVIHGNFKLSGVCDTVCMAELFLDENPMLPLILETAPIKVNINDTIMKVCGTEMNEKLYDFLLKKSELELQASELPRKESRMIMDGLPEEQIAVQLQAEYAKLMNDYDKLVMEYVTKNFDNMLGVSVFMLHTQGAVPMINAQIEDIMSKATETFKNHEYVKAFMKQAEENQRNMFNR